MNNTPNDYLLKMLDGDLRLILLSNKSHPPSKSKKSKKKNGKK